MEMLVIVVYFFFKVVVSVKQTYCLFHLSKLKDTLELIT